METHAVDKSQAYWAEMLIYTDYLRNTRAALAYWQTNVTPDKVAPGLAYYGTDDEDLGAALAYWHITTENNFGLSSQPFSTSCGALHCFGGYLPDMPEFKALGVTRSSSGTPWIVGGVYDGVGGVELATLLFGRPDLFYERGHCVYDHLTRIETSDYEVVTNRLLMHIEILEETL